jgi:PTS system glucose-specific IIA component
MLKNLFNKPKETKIFAPANGKIVALEDVPDPVFNQKMMGEGIAIVPADGEIVSPVNGEVIQVPDTKHAVGIRSEDGMEILIHVGLETVSLNGQGFNMKVKTGDRVSTGQALLDFDLKYVSENAANIITPIVITNSSNSDKQYTMTTEKEGNAGETVIITVS